MHKLFSVFVLLADLALGIVAFGALLAADLSLPIKIFCGSVLLLVAIHHQSAEILGGMEDDLRVGLLTTHVWEIHQRLGGTQEEWRSAEEKVIQEKITSNQAGGGGSSAIKIALARFVLWIAGGWALAAVVGNRALA